MTDAQGGAIIHVDVVAQGSDQGQLGPKIEQAIGTLDRVAEQTEIAPGPVESVAADGAYHDTKDLAELEAPNIQPAVSSGQANRKAPGQDPAHQASQFDHGVEADAVSCPAGQTLKQIGYNANGTSAKFQAKAEACNACPEKGVCCPKAKGGRTVNKTLYPEMLDRIEAHLHTAQGERMLHARQASAEGTFARLIRLLSRKRCRTWGRRGAQAEALWRQLAHNLMLLTGQWQPLALKQQPQA